MPSEKGLVELHREMLELLKVFHGICMKNHIQYTLHGGTLLGAIREKGFIPWDNDADVSLTRENYQKFLECIRREPLGNGISFDGDHRVPRLIKKKNGMPTVFVDLFIYDYITKNHFGTIVKIYGNMFLRAFIEDSVNLTAGRMRKKYSTWKYGLYGLFQKIGKLFPEGIPLKIFTYYNTHFLCGKRDQIFRSNDGYQPIRTWLLPAEDMENIQIVPFEDAMFMVPTDYHEILTLWHGDYMTPRKYDDIEIQAHDLMRELM